MKKCTKRFLFVTTTALAGMYAYNRLVANKAMEKNMLPTKNGSYYSWKQGNIFYTKSGSGKPILLIHDINSASSSVEWSKIIRKLQKNHTVYAIDLLGCGLSDKPCVSYTIYLYVQMIMAFIRDVIGEPTDVAAVNFSAPAVIMANQLDENIIDKIILINPVSFKILNLVPNHKSKLKQTLINLPLVGTFVYNLLYNPARVDRMFRNAYFSKPELISDKLKDTSYQAAHMDNSRGRFLYSSILGNYMNGDIRHAVSKINKPIYLISCRDYKMGLEAAEEYQKLSTHVEVINISNCKLYPHLENPEKIRHIIESVIDH